MLASDALVADLAKPPAARSGELHRGAACGARSSGAARSAAPAGAESRALLSADAWGRRLEPVARRCACPSMTMATRALGASRRGRRRGQHAQNGGRVIRARRVMRSRAAALAALAALALPQAAAPALCCANQTACPGNCTAGYEWGENGSCERCPAGRYSSDGAPCRWCPLSLAPNRDRTGCECAP